MTDQDRETQIAAIKAAVTRGIEDAREGRSEDAEVVLKRLRMQFEALAEQRRASQSLSPEGRGGRARRATAE